MEPDQKRYVPKSMLDIRGDKRTRNVILFLRLISIVFFVPLFAGVPLTFRYSRGFDPVHLWELGLGHLPWVVAFGLMSVALYIVVAFHELIHAALLTLVGKESASISLVGLTIRSYSAYTYLTKIQAFFVVVGPFFIGSTLGIVALLIVPDMGVAWAFLPTLVNAVASGADFVVIAWLIGVPKEGRVSILVDGYVAYEVQ